MYNLKVKIRISLDDVENLKHFWTEREFKLQDALLFITYMHNNLSYFQFFFHIYSLNVRKKSFDYNSNYFDIKISQTANQSIAISHNSVIQIEENQWNHIEIEVFCCCNVEVDSLLSECFVHIIINTLRARMLYSVIHYYNLCCIH